jgi:hypothetical protein
MAALVVTTNDHGGVLWLVSVSVVASLVCFVIALRLQPRAAAGDATAMRPSAIA